MLGAAPFVMLWLAVAPPAPSPVDLRWDAPAGCPGADAVRAGIARGLPPAAASAARVDADVAVTAIDAEHWRAELRLRGADWTATRTLKGPTCAAVADAATLVIDLAVATELGEREVVVAPPPPPPPPPPAPPRPTPTLGVAVASDAGALPSATAGGAVLLGWRSPRFRLDLRGSWLAAQSGTVAGRADTGATVSLGSAMLRGCRMWGDAASLGPCVGAGLDRLHGTGFGPIVPSEGTNYAPFGDIGLQGEARISRWVAAFLSVDGAIPLVRARFSVKDIGQVHEPAAISLRVAAGLELRFR